MSWLYWSKTAPSPPPGRVWSAIDPQLQVCTEIQRAPDACAQKVLKNVYHYLNPELVPDIKPQSCIERGFQRQVLDPEVLQGTYLYQVQNMDSPCNVQPFIYIYKYMP